MYGTVQWYTVEVTEVNCELQFIYGGCQAMSVNFWEYRWILDSLLLIKKVLVYIAQVRKQHIPNTCTMHIHTIRYIVVLLLYISKHKIQLMSLKQ